jgi:hypothetical protein
MSCVAHGWNIHSGRTKFLLDDAEDIRRLRESAVAEVWIDTSKGHDVTRQETLAEANDEADVIAETERTLIAAAESEVEPSRVSMVEEIARAKKICDKSKQAVVSMFQGSTHGTRHIAGSGLFAGRRDLELGATQSRRPDQPGTPQVGPTITPTCIQWRSAP